ncbi:MAG: hypothetical protein AMXMBFR84_18290 [Candidatus Hydrogenedentota bacterium]
MPQPIDMQTEVARVTAVERIQQVAGRLSLAAQQHQANQAAAEQLAAETQVQQSHAAENPDVDAEGRRKNPFAGRRRRKAEGMEEPHSDPRRDAAQKPVIQDGESEHHLDVTV